MSTQSDPAKIPARACTLAGGTFAISDTNGDNAKSHPVTLRARSAEAIEHWFWGRIVHDFAGMRMTKNRVPIDYCHDTKDIVGYANRHSVDSDGLELSGALVPWRDSDRASEIAYKSGQGVPYEASINFGGDGIRFELVDDGQTAEANGRQYEGPVVIVREWPLRGVALCPYGADEHTAAQFAEGEFVTAQQVNASAKTEEIAEMTETPTNPEAVEVDETAVEEAAPELAQAVETAAATEATETPETAAETAGTDTATETVNIDAKAFAALVTEFGADIAATVSLAGGGRTEALALANESLSAEVKALTTERDGLAKQVAELGAATGGRPAKPSAETSTKKSIWK